MMRRKLEYKYCHECGKQNYIDSKVCRACETKLIGKREIRVYRRRTGRRSDGSMKLNLPFGVRVKL